MYSYIIDVSENRLKKYKPLGPHEMQNQVSFLNLKERFKSMV